MIQSPLRTMSLAPRVTEATTDVLIESAHFDRRRVRIGARELSMHTDSSHRFERGADPGICRAAADRAARRVLEERGYGDAIFHRTGHGMDRALHGFGPNLDSVETRDERPLTEGVGFSVEPGVYLEGEFGVRSEINVHMTPEGPEVTTPDVQAEPWTAGDPEGAGP